MEGCGLKRVRGVFFLPIVQNFPDSEREREMYNTVAIYSIGKGMLRGDYVYTYSRSVNWATATRRCFLGKVSW